MKTRLILICGILISMSSSLVAQKMVVYSEKNVYFELKVKGESLPSTNAVYQFDLPVGETFEVVIPQVKQRIQKKAHRAMVNVYVLTTRPKDKTYYLDFRGAYDSIQLVPKSIRKAFDKAPPKKKLTKKVAKPKDSIKKGGKTKPSPKVSIAKKDSRMTIESAVTTLNKQRSDAQKITYIKEWFRDKKKIVFGNIRIEQIRQLTSTLNNDGAVLDVLLYLYPHCIEQNKYLHLKDNLIYKASQQMFIQYYESKKSNEINEF